MPEYVKLADAVRTVLDKPDMTPDEKDGVVRRLKALPAADVAPVRHGRWIEQPPDFDLCGVAYYQCSECGKEQQTPSHYC